MSCLFCLVLIGPILFLSVASSSYTFLHHDIGGHKYPRSFVIFSCSHPLFVVFVILFICLLAFAIIFHFFWVIPLVVLPGWMLLLCFCFCFFFLGGLFFLSFRWLWFPICFFAWLRFFISFLCRRVFICDSLGSHLSFFLLEYSLVHRHLVLEVLDFVSVISWLFECSCPLLLVEYF